MIKVVNAGSGGWQRGEVGASKHHHMTPLQRCDNRYRGVGAVVMHKCSSHTMRVMITDDAIGPSDYTLYCVNIVSIYGRKNMRCHCS
jgi:hypothetical protein